MANVTELKETLITLTADVVAAHVTNNSIALRDISALISTVHSALAALDDKTMPEPAPMQAPAVSIRASIRPDYLVSLEDGKKLKMLKRHLMTHHNLTPDQYRTKWGLPVDYPMVAPNYAERRRTIAISIGLGTKGRSKTR